MATTRARKRAALQSAQAKYDAAGTGRRIAKWNPASTGPVKAVEGLEKIRNRARDAVRNDWAAGSSVQKWVSNLIGVGIQPRLKNAAHREVWDSWVPQADADGVLDAYGLQALAVRSWLDGGEVFIRRRPRDPSLPLAVPMQIQLIESDYVPMFDADIWPGLPQGNTIKQGIERNRFGRRTAYWVYKEHPGDGAQAPGRDQLIRIPASEIRHVFEPVRAGQLRGVSPLANVLVRLRSSGDFEDAVLERQKLANLFAMFITRPLPPDSADLEYDPLTGLPKFYDSAGNVVAGLEPGISQELRPGEQVQFANPPEAGTTYSDYMRSTHLGTAAGQGLPYELMAGDIRDVSDRTLRVVINEFRRFAQQRQWHIVIPMICQPMLAWCMQAAALVGKVAVADVETASVAEWQPQGWEYIHPVQDAQGKQLLIEMGVVSKSQVIAERGDDPEKVFKQRADDKKREDELGLTPLPPPGPGDQNADEDTDPADDKEEPQRPDPNAELIGVIRAQVDALAAPRAQAPDTSKEVLAVVSGLIENVVSAQAAQSAALLQGLQALATAVASQRTEINVQPAEVRADIHTPTPVVNVENRVDVPAPIVNVEAPNVTVNAEVAEPVVNVNLPDRRVESEITRDREGNIVNVVQTERTVQ